MTDAKVIPLRAPAEQAPRFWAPVRVFAVVMFDRETGRPTGLADFDTDHAECEKALADLNANAPLEAAGNGFAIAPYIWETPHLDAIKASTIARHDRWAAATRRRIAQHEDNLAMWKEPDGFLVRTEPDPEERDLVRRDLRTAIEELRRLGAEIGVPL